MYIPSVGNHCLGDNKAQVLSKLFLSTHWAGSKRQNESAKMLKTRARLRRGFVGWDPAW